jgi:hypothetical protein
MKPASLVRLSPKLRLWRQIITVNVREPADRSSNIAA